MLDALILVRKISAISGMETMDTDQSTDTV